MNTFLKSKPIAKIAILGTPKCGHAFLMNILDSIYWPEIVSGDHYFSNTVDLKKFHHGVIFNSHQAPDARIVEMLARDKFQILCPIRNPLDNILSWLHFYRRQPTDLLEPAQYNLVSSDELLNTHVEKWVLSGAYEASFINSFLWLREGGHLVRFENLIRRPLETIKSFCDKIHGVPEIEILSAYFANTMDIFSSFEANSRHISGNASEKYRSYDWAPLLAESTRAQRIYDYITSSPIYDAYKNLVIEEDIPTRPVVFSREMFPFFRKCFFLSTFYLEMVDPQLALEAYTRYFYSPIDDDPFTLPGAAMEIYRHRSDLNIAFPDPLGANRREFINWLLNQAIVEYDLPHQVLRATYKSILNQK